MPLLPQPVLIDLLSLAVGKTALKEQMSPEEFRNLITGQYDQLVSGERLRLQVMWNLFAPRDGFDAKVAACPMCWLKTLEPRLGVPVDLPGALGALKSSDVATQAAKVFVRREDVDRLLGPDTGQRVRATTPLPVSYQRAAAAAPPPTASFDPVSQSGVRSVSQSGVRPLEPGAPPLSMTNQVQTLPNLPVAAPMSLSSQQKAFAGIAVATLLASSAILVLTLKGSCAKAPTAIVLRVADLPVQPGKQLGQDATFVLTDASWLSTPEAQRTSQLKAALESARGRGVENLAILDGEGKMRASVQWTGTEARVRWY